jgi:ribosomal protein S18 acetylase RimI-like enzyme
VTKGISDMTDFHPRQKQLEAALTTLSIPPGIQLRCWTDEDFPDVERLSTLQGWPTPHDRSEEALVAWQHSWPTLVLSEGEWVIGFVRGMTDGEITMYIAELLIDADYRGKGLGHLLLDACHALYPHARLDLISTEESNPFYKAIGFRYVGEGVRKSYR